MNGYIISVNGIWHQTMQRIQDKEAFYHAPYIALGDRSRYRRVLIIGAGSGNDVAFALHYGAEHIDAVEIDPGIIKLGRTLHPEHPYADGRVHVTIDDARDFLHHPVGPYDLIIFGLPDSLTLSSSVSNLRLESYLFTAECFEAVKSHLAPNGIVVLYNYYQKPWLVDKLGGMLQSVFGTEPQVFLWKGYGYVATIFIGPGTRQLMPLSGQRIPLSRTMPPPARDDWPFLYLLKPSLPSIYIRFILFVVATSLTAIWLVAPKGTLQAFDPRLFFMGSAFMLLEASAVVRLSLLFGGTWRVNAAVFTGVLLMVLAAIAVRRRSGPLRLTWWIPALAVSLAMIGYFPLQSFGSIPLGGWLAAILIMVPIFLANVIFTNRFAHSTAPHVSLASNVLGAIAGGLLEYISMLVGYQALLIPVALLYAAAFLWPARRAQKEPEPMAS